MNNSITVTCLLDTVKDVLARKEYEDPAAMLEFCNKLEQSLSTLLEDDIDFKTVINSLDDSILITDSNSKVIYVNPNYKNNTGIAPEQILGKKISDIVAEGSLFTGGAVLDVLRTKEKAFRLSSVNVTTPPQTGYVVGVPLLDKKGNVKQVIASSRPIFSLQSLQEDFEKFLQEANALRKKQSNTRIVKRAEDSASTSGKLIGTSSALKALYRTIEKVAPSNGTVLVTGESGVGKEIISDEIYRLSSRSDKPFIKVNCASIPLNLLESELFGYEKGAFFGCKQYR